MTSKPKTNIFILCPKCQGKGFIENKPCAYCKGKGVYVLIPPFLFYWDKKISGIQIIAEKIQKIIHGLISLVLIAIALAGALILVLRILGTFGLRGGTGFIQAQLATDLTAAYPLIFWIALLIYLYFIYKKKRNQELLEENKVKRVSLALPETQPIWEDALKIQQKNKIEISRSFSPLAIKAVLKARDLALKLDHQEILPLHLFASLLSSKRIQDIFAHLGISTKNLKSTVINNLGKLKENRRWFPQFSVDSKIILLKAYLFALQGRSPQVGINELLMAVMSTPSMAQEILLDLEIDLDKIINVTIWLDIKRKLRRRMRRFQTTRKYKPKGVMNRAMTAVATPYLDQFGQDLTALARADVLSYCVGRDEEINSIFQIIQSGANSVVLVGNPGVGKTTIINGIARLMVTEDVPPVLQDKRLVSLSLSSVISGGAGIGAIEERLRRIIYEVERAGNIVLVISDIHNAVGVSSTSGELDISEIIAEEIAAKRFILIGTSDPVNYKRYLESQSLGNVLEKVEIKEPQGNKAIQILEAEAGFIENKYNIFFSYDSIERAVNLSSRYLHDRYLPEKGIMLLEEAALYVRNTKGKKALVTGEDMARLVAQKTNIPLTKITEKESQKLLNLEEQIHQRLINQTRAVKAVSNALRRARTELRDTERTIANLLFLGPTGVGKTELAKTVAEIYFGSEENIIRLDMSEYQEKDSIKRMIGSPASGEGGILTEAVRKSPFSLLLLDEIEKAHPDILNLFLQVMEDGRLTDATGRTVDFRNIILIGTSNAGAFFIQEAIKNNLSTKEIKEKLISQELKPYFRPEFLNRFDDIIVFRILTMEEIQKIARLMLNKVAKQLLEKGIILKVTDEAVVELAKQGFDPKFGARPLRRVIQEKVQNALAKYLLEGKLDRRDVAVLEPGGVIRVEKAEEI